MTTDMLGIFHGDDYQVNEAITIHNPTLEEIYRFGEHEYFAMASSLCCSPADCKSELDDLGVDFCEIDDYELFLLIARGWPQQKTCILLGDLDFSSLVIGVNKENGEYGLVRSDGSLVIDRGIYTVLVDVLRKMHYFKRNEETAGNKLTRQIMVQEDREQKKRQAAQKESSILAPLISSLVNCADFKYDYTTIWSLPVYTFMDAVKRIQKIWHYKEIMTGVYSGCVDLKKMNNKEEINWLGELVN